MPNILVRCPTADDDLSGIQDTIMAVVSGDDDAGARAVLFRPAGAAALAELAWGRLLSNKEAMTV